MGTFESAFAKVGKMIDEKFAQIEQSINQPVNPPVLPPVVTPPVVVPPVVTPPVVPTPPSGGTITKKKPLLLHLWGNGGDRLNGGQATHRGERWMLSQPQFRHQLPFFGKDTPPEVIEVDHYVNGKIVGKKNVTATVDYLCTDEVMKQVIDYTKKGKLDGFNFHFYADDATLKEFRQAFVRATDKKGLKMSYMLGTYGGGFESYPNQSEYTNSLNTIVTSMKQDYFQRVDGKPVLSLMSSNNEINSKGNTEALTTKRRIEELYGGEIYWVLVVDFYDRGQWYKENGFDAVSHYYHYGNYDNYDFIECVNISKDSNELNKSRGINVAPIITCGLDTRARIWHEWEGNAGKYYERSTVTANLPTLIQNTINFLNDNDDSKIGYVVHGDENTEQALGFLPLKRADNTIDDEVVNIFKRTIS